MAPARGRKKALYKPEKKPCRRRKGEIPISSSGEGGGGEFCCMSCSQKEEDFAAEKKPKGAGSGSFKEVPPKLAVPADGENESSTGNRPKEETESAAGERGEKANERDADGREGKILSKGRGSSTGRKEGTPSNVEACTKKTSHYKRHSQYQLMSEGGVYLLKEEGY